MKTEEFSQWALCVSDIYSSITATGLQLKTNGFIDESFYIFYELSINLVLEMSQNSEECPPEPKVMSSISLFCDTQIFCHVALN